MYLKKIFAQALVLTSLFIGQVNAGNLGLNPLKKDFHEVFENLETPKNGTLSADGAVKTATMEIADNNLSFSQAKKKLPLIFKKLDNPKTLYCGCDIKFKRNGYDVDLDSCGYKIRASRQRAQRLEAEHIVSAWEFAHNLQCWQQGGRKNCARTDEVYKEIEGDLHNLYPAVGEINSDRANFKFAKDVKAPHNYGKCEMRIDTKRQRVSPPPRSRGIIARTYLYMHERYQVPLSRAELGLFNEWNKAYPPTRNECIRNQEIAKIQGNDNPFVTAKCKKVK